MTKPRPAKPIESFSPLLFKTLIEGAKKPIELRLPFNEAVKFRQRINQLRNQMRLQGHEQYSMASQAKVSIEWPPDTEVHSSRKGVKWPKDTKTMCKVTISPADSEFDAVLTQAGITAPTLVNDPTQDTIVDDPLAEYLRK